MKRSAERRGAKTPAWGPGKKRDQYTVVLEDLRSNFKLFGENLDFVRKDVKAIKQTLGEHGRALNTHTQVLNEHGRVLNTHTQMIGKLMVDVQEIKNDLKQKVDRGEFARLEKRVLVLESREYAGRGRR